MAVLLYQILLSSTYSSRTALGSAAGLAAAGAAAGAALGSSCGWAQNGVAMPQEIIDALVPGSVVSISYSSENGDLWIVMNEAAAGWMRVGQGNADGSGSDSAAFNGSICQITYEQIAALCSDDVSTWGSTMQCEASGAWEVFSVTVGQSNAQ